MMHIPNLAPAKLLVLVMAAALFLGLTERTASAATGQLELTVVDKDTGQPIACRMHLLGPGKRPRKPEGVPYWYDHFAMPGKILLKLPLGEYSFVLERGLEYLDIKGRFVINVFANDAKKIELRRFVDMSADGWWSGDLDVRRSVRDIELLMEADDLHVAEVVTWQNNKNPWVGRLPKEPLVQFDANRYYQLMAGAAVQPGTELLLLQLPSPLKLPPANAEYPPLVKQLVDTRAKGALWVDASKPFWWDLPMLIAAGQIDSIELAHSHICRDSTINNEADGKPRDRKRYASYRGDAQWSHEIYFRLLECGLRIPPTAGSGSGESPNPLGYNRVYVHVGEKFNYEEWWNNLRAGRVFITNGPLMKPSVEGQLPGYVFQAEQGAMLDLQPALTFSTRDPISYLEIVKDGRIEQEIRFDDYAKTKTLPKLSFTRSGWFLIRAVTNTPNTYRFAMTAPYYVEIDGQRRISKQAAQFFLDWVIERAKQIKLADPEQQKSLIEWHRRARDFWQDLVAKANVE
jgi:hypothetical protein